MATCTIYIITNTINDKIYIGQTWQLLTQRIAKHRYDSKTIKTKFYYAMRKHGKDNFYINTIAECSSQEVADYLEKSYIEEYNSIKLGYNTKEGGSKGRCSESTKKKISDAQKGKPRPYAIGNKGGLGGAKLNYTNKTWKLINGKRVWMEK